MSESLPHNGRRVSAASRRFKDTIVFVHHFGGNRASVKRHQDFVADLGFDSVSFTLSMPQRPKWLERFLLNDLKPGLRQSWQQEIADIFNAVPGPKIAYSFSFPSAPTAMVIAEAAPDQCRAWICDGGPFLMPIRCFWNYFTHAEPTKQLWRKSARMALGYASLGFWNLDRDLHAALGKFKSGFPILSIRSWQDPLVPIAAIDAAFEGHPQLQLETLTLPEAGHLDGLPRFPDEYKPRVEKFLNTYAEPL